MGELEPGMVGLSLSHLIGWSGRIGKLKKVMAKKDGRCGNYENEINNWTG